MHRALALAVFLVGLAIVHGCATPSPDGLSPGMSKSAMGPLVKLLRLNLMAPTLYGDGVVVTDPLLYPEPQDYCGWGWYPEERCFIVFKTSDSVGSMVLSSDCDAADLYRRITGKEHPTVKGELSADYKAFLEGKGR